MGHAYRLEQQRHLVHLPHLIVQMLTIEIHDDDVIVIVNVVTVMAVGEAVEAVEAAMVVKVVVVIYSCIEVIIGLPDIRSHRMVHRIPSYFDNPNPTYLAPPQGERY